MRGWHLLPIAYDHRLYALGGYGRTLDRTSRAFYRYEPDRDRWTRMRDLPAPRAAMAAEIVGSRLIVAGGANYEVPLSDAFAFDFAANRWSRLPPMPDRREHVGAAVLDGDLYVLGGRNSRSFALSAATSYDVERRRWRRLPRLPVPTGGMAVVARGDSVLVIGASRRQDLGDRRIAVRVLQLHRQRRVAAPG